MIGIKKDTTPAPTGRNDTSNVYDNHWLYLPIYANSLLGQEGDTVTKKLAELTLVKIYPKRKRSDFITY